MQLCCEASKGLKPYVFFFFIIMFYRPAKHSSTFFHFMAKLCLPQNAPVACIIISNHLFSVVLLTHTHTLAIAFSVTSLKLKTHLLVISAICRVVKIFPRIFLMLVTTPWLLLMSDEGTTSRAAQYMICHCPLMKRTCLFSVLRWTWGEVIRPCPQCNRPRRHHSPTMLSAMCVSSVVITQLDISSANTPC